MNNSVQRGQNENFQKTIKTVTQILETRSYWLHALSDVKKIISNQRALHFLNAKAEYVASLNLRNVVWERYGYVIKANRGAYLSHLTHPLDDWTWPSDPIHHIRVLWGSWPGIGMKQAKARGWRYF